MYVKLK